MADKVVAQRIVELMAENNQLKRYLESLTPGGSEFYNDPKRCVEWIRERLSGVVKQVKKRKAAEALVEDLVAVVKVIKISPAYNMGPTICPWCYTDTTYHGHRSDCIRQAALARVLT